MQIKDLLVEGKNIWGNEKLPLAQIIVRMGKIFGDICRYERNAPKDVTIHTDEELQKEMGNIILATILRCDELGYDPEECIQLAVDCQKKFMKK